MPRDMRHTGGGGGSGSGGGGGRASCQSSYLGAAASPNATRRATLASTKTLPSFSSRARSASQCRGVHGGRAETGPRARAHKVTKLHTYQALVGHVASTARS